MPNIAGIERIDVLARDEILIEFNQLLKNDDQARLVSNYSVVPVDSGVPVLIKDVLLQNEFGSAQIVLVVSPFTIGETYEVSINESLNWLSKDTLNSAKKTRRFIGRLTKIDSVVDSRPAFYDTRPTATFRQLINAIHYEDELIGGSKSEFISLNDDLLIGAEALFTKIDTYIVDSDTDQFDFPGAVDGEALKEILIRFWLNNVDAPTSRDFKVYPNGVKGSAAVSLVNQTGLVSSDSTRASLAFIAPTARERFSGYIRMQTILNPGGTTLSFARRFEGFTTLGDIVLDPSTSGFYRANGWWDYADGALTSLSIVATDGGADTLQAAIGAGSVFELWKLQE